jgi:drug/metabolite transporter (DMT)-like permease
MSLSKIELARIISFFMVNWLGIGLVFIAMFVWGASSNVYKFALGNQSDVKGDPISALSVRIIIVFLVVFTTALIFENPFGVFQMEKEEMWRYLGIGALSGVLTILGDICYFKTLQLLDSCRVYPLVNTQALFTFPLAALLFNDEITIFIWISGALMIIGVLFFGNRDNMDKGVDTLDEGKRKRTYIIGFFAGLTVGFFYATQYITMTLAQSYYQGAFTQNSVRVLTFLVVLWSYMLITKKHIPKFSTPQDKAAMKSYLIIGIMGGFSMGICDGLYQIGVAMNNSSISIVIASNAPLVNQFFGVLLLKEKFRPKFLIGVLLIIFANILVII